MVAASRTASLLREHKNQIDAPTGGFRLASALSVTFVLVSLVVALFVLRTPRSDAPAAAERGPSDATATACPAPSRMVRPAGRTTPLFHKQGPSKGCWRRLGGGMPG